ncbi:MAG: aminoacyl-tRNA hydrolase [Exilispira sp.]
MNKSDNNNPMILIAGLGNPGGNYYKHRHNLGFQFIDYIAKRITGSKKVDFITKKKKADFISLKYEGKEVTLVKPLTFMNNSGEGILFMAAFLKIHEENIIVIYDDIDLEFGDLRLRCSKNYTNHNGIISVEKLLKKENFTRLRIGIGKPKDENGKILNDPKYFQDYVLSDFSLVEEYQLENIIFNHTFNVIKGFIKGGYDSAYNELDRARIKIKDEISRGQSLSFSE